MNSLPIQIFNDVRQPQANIVERAWGSALTLVLMILLLTLVARTVQRRSRLDMTMKPQETRVAGRGRSVVSETPQVEHTADAGG